MPRVSLRQTGLDQVLAGGLPQGRTTVVCGTAGSGKTILGIQFLSDGAQQGEPGVFVTFEETPDDLRRNARALGFDIADHEENGAWRFVDATFDPGAEEELVGSYDFAGLLARVEHAVRVSGATRVVIDSFGVVLTRFPDAPTVRRELHRLVTVLRDLEVTAIVTSERNDDYGPLSRHGVEEFVADNVMVLRNALDEETRRRTVEVLKLRGCDHQTGEFPLTILPDEGIVAITLEPELATTGSTSERIAFGLTELDEMCGGGMYRDSVALVSGATGTGKTLLVTEFAAGGVRRGERSLILSFEESNSQIQRNAIGWGHDFPAYIDSGNLRVVSIYPEMRSLEDHLVAIRRVIEEYQPDRLAVDSLSALERIAPARSFRSFLIGLTSFIKQKQIAALLTSTARTLMGGESSTEAHISTLTDIIVLLRYVEVGGEIRRGCTVLKLRGSTHDKRIHEFDIDGEGMHIRAPFRDVAGILAGAPRQLRDPERQVDEVTSFFDLPGSDGA
ncbi:MAG: circadian clock protein KaiC [Nocardioides sp.]|nr:circadian clock protein KaiC [Nocardioides sp.]